MLLYLCNPVMDNYGGRRMNDVYGWGDPVALAQQVASDFEASSHGRVRYRIVETVDDGTFPYLDTGFQYTAESFDAAWRSGNLEPGTFDYVRFGQRLPIYTSNIVFFMGIVDFVARDDGLAPLRSKGMTARPLTIKSDATPTLVKLSNVVGVPLLFIGFGLLRWRIRLARRKRARL